MLDNDFLPIEIGVVRSDHTRHRLIYCENDAGDPLRCDSFDDTFNLDVLRGNTDIGHYDDVWSGDGFGTLYYVVDNEFYKGDLDLIRLYNCALSAEQVAELMIESSQMLHLRFDEPPNANVFADSSINRSGASCAPGRCPLAGVDGRNSQVIYSSMASTTV